MQPTSNDPARMHASRALAPAVWKFGLSVFHAETRPEWRAWLEANHERERGVWLCSWRPVTNRPRCPYPQVVEEALCFGWIDSTASNLDDERSLQLITPRRPKSSWTRLNRQRVAELEAAGLMTDAGRRSVDTAKANGYWTLYDAVEDLIEPDDLVAALDADKGVRACWEAIARSTRKTMLWNVISATAPKTRRSRIDAIVTRLRDDGGSGPNR